MSRDIGIDSCRIPNIFHFVFGLRPQTEPFHLAFYLCLASCRNVNAPDAIYVYFHHEPWGAYWDLALEFVTPVRVPLDDFIAGFEYKDRSITPYRYAHHSDFIRLERLLERGGIYADMDTIFVKRVPNELRAHSFVLGREGDVLVGGDPTPRASLCNAVILAEPGAPFGRLWLEEMKKTFDGSWSAHSTLLPERLRQQHPDLIHVEPEERFYRYAWTREGLAALLERNEPHLDGVLSIHLWSHLWWSRRRRDFSSFHAGRLTDRFIRTVDTTYNVLARPHLPPPPPLGRRASDLARSFVRRVSAA